MRSSETNVLGNSDYYVYTASTQAQKTFLYPVCVGYFYYSDQYTLHRTSFDSFLVMQIKKGQCYVKADNQTYLAKEHQIVILDCYKPHTYYSDGAWEAEWLHFDGPVAREYFNLISQNYGLVMSLTNPYRFEKYLHKIYTVFSEKQSVKEPLISQYITNILTELLISHENTSQQPTHPDAIEETVAYINDHISENLTLEQLAQRTSLSPYYFTRLFKKETGFTPHQYIIASRINFAKYLLRNTEIPIKEICCNCGFANESSFCTTFKKWEQTTPGDYRGAEAAGG